MYASVLSAPSTAPSLHLISSTYGFAHQLNYTLYHQLYVLLPSLSKTHLTNLSLLLHITIRTSWSESSQFAALFWETVHISRPITRNKVRTIHYRTLNMLVNRQTDYSVLELNQQQIELVDSPDIERSSPISNGSNASSAAEDLCHDNPANDYFSRNMTEEMTNGLPAEETLIYTECGEYAFASEKGHGVVARERAQFTRCEDEEIHIPGAIQPHGMLVGLEMIGDTNTRYLVRVVSENSEAICKHTSRNLLALSDFVSIFPSTYRSTFQKCALDIRIQFKNTGKSQEPKVFPIEFQDQEGKRMAVWCAVHFVGGSHNLLVCEFELRSNSNVITTSSDLPSTPYASLDSELPDTDSSFTNKSTPLNIDLRDTFKQGSTMELLGIVSQVQHQLSSQKDIQGLLDTIVGLMMQLTGYHRCMVYQFGIYLVPNLMCRF
jgi:hypothetical protein